MRFKDEEIAPLSDNISESSRRLSDFDSESHRSASEELALLLRSEDSLKCHLSNRFNHQATYHFDEDPVHEETLLELPTPSS